MKRLVVVLVLLLAVACAAVGWLYVRVFYGLRDYVFHPLPIPRHVKPALGGLLLGLLALAFPQLMTGGYGWVQWGAIGLPLLARMYVRQKDVKAQCLGVLRGVPFRTKLVLAGDLLAWAHQANHPRRSLA